MKTRVPLPGTPVRGSRSGRPVMALLDLLGRRMTLRVLWELGTRELTFRELLDAAGTNPSVLNTRLRELRDAGLVIHQEGKGYRLSAAGTGLLEALEPVAAWSSAWKIPKKIPKKATA